MPNYPSLDSKIEAAHQTCSRSFDSIARSRVGDFVRRARTRRLVAIRIAASPVQDTGAVLHACSAGLRCFPVESNCHGVQILRPLRHSASELHGVTRQQSGARCGLAPSQLCAPLAPISKDCAWYPVCNKAHCPMCQGGSNRDGSTAVCKGENTMRVAL